MAKLTIEGSIVVIKDAVTNAKNYTSREFVVKTEEEYPQLLSVQLGGDKINLIDSFNQGDKVKVQCNLNGKSWNDKNGEVKYFNSLTAWAIYKNNKTIDPPAPTNYAKQDFSSDDVPF